MSRTKPRPKPARTPRPKPRGEMPYSYRNKGDLTTGPVRKHLVRLSIPMIWSMLAVISVQLVDTFFIAQLGTNELAGISFTFPVTMLISHLVFGLNVAMSSVISRMIGEKKAEDAKRVTLHGMALAFMVSVVISFITWLLLDPVFRMLGADNVTMPVIKAYMPLWLVGSAILALPVNGNSAVRAGGDTFLPSIVMLSIALINLALAPVMIFGLFGFPALKVFGAALATLVACCCGAVFGIYVVAVKKSMLPHALHLDQFGDSAKRLAVIAIPAGITNIITPATGALITSLLAAHGDAAVAAFGVASRLEAFAMIFVIALALGMAPVVGQNWGAGIYTRVHQAIIDAIGLNFIWSFSVAAIFGALAHTIGRAFSQDETVLHYVTLYFWMVPLTYGFGNLVFGWSSAFNAMGQPQRSFVMIAVKSLVLTIPAVIIGGDLYGVPGVFLAIALTNILSGILFHAISWRACMQQEEDRRHEEATAAI